MQPEVPLAHEAATRVPAEPYSMWRLFLISSAGLYLEIVLIRWLGTEVKIFAFFQNLSLIVCFLGFGVGCFNPSKRGSLLPSLFAATTLVGVVGLPFKGWHEFLRILSSVLSYTSDAALWGNALTFSGTEYSKFLITSLAVVAMFLLLIAIAMIPLGRWVGYYLEASSNTVSAYSINLLGSLVGIWLLALFAFFWLSPPYWFAVAFLLIVLSQPFSWRSLLISCGLLAITLLALRPSAGLSTFWSPYQKISVQSLAHDQYQIYVNNEGYMTIANLTPGYLATDPELAKQYQDSSYDSPYRFAKSVDRVLVVGSGAGNDVAAALRHGASWVDAVEIDPAISTIGKRLHPEQPYQSPKVHLINNDARNFMRQCTSKYDMVVFGLLDSHTEFSGYSNVRVDNYVYTEESFREAKNLLRPGGTLVLKFEVRRPWTWMGQRFYSMLSDVFARAPLTYYAPAVGGLLSGTVFLETNSPQSPGFTLDPEQTAFVNSHAPNFPLTVENAPIPTTDDWPYIYYFGHSIPRAYFWVSAVILVLALYMVGPFFRPRESSTWQFFLLGAGFLLMETQLVSRLALYFGTTWLVNCVALTGVLTVLLLANFYVRYRQPERLNLYYLVLCGGLLVDYVVPWSKVPGSGVFVGVLICIAYCVPIFFAGVIFAECFRRVSGRSDAFGSNMLGAVAGGLAQNLSFIFGMKALLLVAVVIYGSAALLQLVRPFKGLEPIRN